MIRQLFKMMWHRKGKNFLLLVEIFFSFIVLFATSTLIIESLRNYFTPIGFDYEDVYVLSMDRHGEEGAVAMEKVKQIKRAVEAMPEIKSHSVSFSNTPFSFSTMNWDVKYGDRSEIADQYRVDPSYFETLDLEIKVGRWLEKGDIGKITPIVINERLADKLFLGENPLGKRISSGGEAQEGEVVGVIKSFRSDGEFESPEMSTFHLMNLEDSTTEVPSSIVIEVKSGISPAWQPNLVEKVNNIADNWTVEIESMPEMRARKAKLTMIPIIAFSIVCGFLVFNVALGLFGVLWYNINKRYAEIGIRRALGATQSSIRIQMLGEVLVLATLGLVVGTVLAIQFLLLGVFNIETNIYCIAIGASLVIIYLIVAVCAWYPSRQASYIEPAVALHYE